MTIFRRSRRSIEYIGNGEGLAQTRRRLRLHDSTRSLADCVALSSNTQVLLARILCPQHFRELLSFCTITVVLEIIAFTRSLTPLVHCRHSTVCIAISRLPWLKAEEGTPGPQTASTTRGATTFFGRLDSRHTTSRLYPPQFAATPSEYDDKLRLNVTG